MYIIATLIYMLLQMQQKLTNSFEWTQKYSTLETCLEELNRCRWKNGFTCPKCDHQVALIAGTVFEHTRLSLPKWFAAVYLIGSDNGGNSVQRISEMTGVTWPTAYRMLRNFRQSKRNRNCGAWFEGLAEVDDTFLGGHKPSKKGCGAVGKKLLTFAVGQLENSMCFIAARLVERVNSEQFQEFALRVLFCFNRRFWEPELPDQLPQAAVDHVPIRVSFNSV